MGKHQPSDVRRAQILGAATEVCAEKGYHASRIDDIAARAGLSKGAVYHHFASKQEVFLGVMEMMLSEATEYITSLDEAGASVAETMSRTIDMLLGMLDQGPELLRGMFELFFLGIRDREFRERLEKHYDSMLDVTERVIRHGVDRGELSADVDPEAAARVFVMGGDGLLFMLVMLDQHHLGAESVKLNTDLLFKGMACKPGEGKHS